MIASEVRVIAGTDGERTIPVADVVTGPGQLSLADGEFVVEFEIDDPPANTGDAYIRMTPRTEMDIAIVGAAVRVTMDGDTCTDARVVLGAVAPTAVQVPDAEAASSARASTRRPLPRSPLRPPRQTRSTTSAAYRVPRPGHRCARQAGRRPRRRKGRMSRTHITCTVNGEDTDFLANPGTSLLDALRDELGLTGAKEGCGAGDCGACSILMDGKVTCACWCSPWWGRDLLGRGSVLRRRG